MKKTNKNKQKRNKLLASGLLSFVLAIISFGAGIYIGLMTMNYNYITIGTMQGSNSIMILFVCSGLFIALGVVSISVGMKLLSMRKSTNFVFYTKKSVIISSLVFYTVIFIISIIAIAMCFSRYIPSVYSITTFVLSALAVVLCVLCFFFTFKELKAFMNKIKSGEMTIQIEYPKRYTPISKTPEALAKNTYTSNSMNIYDLSHELVRLDEMRNKGLINSQEYEQLKEYYMNRVNSKIY